MTPFRGSLSCVLLSILSSVLAGQKFRPNYAESQVPKYQLPNPLRRANGKSATAAWWRSSRRNKILSDFEQYVYGKSPGGAHADLRITDTGRALGGKAMRKQITIRCRTGGADQRELRLQLLLFVPVARAKKGPVPAFLGLNFHGNHTIHPDPAIHVPTSWVRPGMGAKGNRATAKGRGRRAHRWPVERILDRGYALATVYYGDIDPDFDDGFRNGVHGLLTPRPAATATSPASPNSKTPSRAPNAGGSIAAWAWGLRRALDALDSDPHIDGTRVAVFGHSRLGKTALWAGALDQRFALVVANGSGCGGAALSRRAYGETVERITSVFPHWFCNRFALYAKEVHRLPVDQHMLIALVAPRPVLICSAVGDRWADPKGEFLSARHASPVYELLGQRGIAADAEMPVPGKLLRTRVGYHIREGRHDLNATDWGAILDFADHHGLAGRRR